MVLSLNISYVLPVSLRQLVTFTQSVSSLPTAHQDKSYNSFGNISFRFDGFPETISFRWILVSFTAGAVIWLFSSVVCFWSLSSVLLIRSLQSSHLSLSSAPCQVFVISLYSHSLGEFTNHGKAFKQNHEINHSELLSLQKTNDEWCNEGFCSLVLDGMPRKHFLPKTLFNNVSTTDTWKTPNIFREFFSKINAKNVSKIYPKNIKL